MGLIPVKSNTLGVCKNVPFTQTCFVNSLLSATERGLFCFDVLAIIIAVQM